MNGFDPKSSNVSGQYPQQNQTQKADGSRKLTIQGKKTNVSRPRKWLNKLVSAFSAKKSDIRLHQVINQQRQREPRSGSVQPLWPKPVITLTSDVHFLQPLNQQNQQSKQK